MLCSGCANIKKFLHVLLIINKLSIKNYFPMQNVKFIDNQLVTRRVVQMWFKFFGNNFHVAGTKTDLDSLQ